LSGFIQDIPITNEGYSCVPCIVARQTGKTTKAAERKTRRKAGIWNRRWTQIYTDKKMPPA
jgi:hypothetical protein